MANILGVGIATLDIINTVEDFPAEDAEVRAIRQAVRRGGNATNTLVVLSQLGHGCHWAGTLADDVDSRVISDELARYGIDASRVSVIPGGHAPTSYVTLNQRNGSRTIVHYRDLAEYSAAAFQRIALADFDWLHFEGRNVTETHAMLQHARARAPQLPISLEIEKPRENIEALCGLADLLLYSRIYAEHRGFVEGTGGPEAFLTGQQRSFPNADHVCTWGAAGAYGITRQGQFFHAGAYSPPHLVDTLGAGDTFNAGMIDASLRQYSLDSALQHANRLAGLKCGQPGFAGLGEQFL